MESLYSNKFSDFGDLERPKSGKPMSPFKFITRKIVKNRKNDLGPEFATSLTPNEMIE